MDTARKFLMDSLKPLLPSGWRLYPYFTNLDVQAGVVAMLVLETVTPLPESPLDSHLVEFTLQLREPKTDPAKREDALDTNLDALLFALGTVPNVRWSKAERILHGAPGNESLSFDISLSVVTNP